MKRTALLPVLILVLFAVTAVPAAAAANNVSLSTFLITAPKLGERWAIGLKYVIRYKQVNVATDGIWVRLVKGGQVVGDILYNTPVSVATQEYSYGFKCGQALLNHAPYGPGDDYQIEVATHDGKVSKRGTLFSIVTLPVPK
jgi:hypothetical protein